VFRRFLLEQAVPPFSLTQAAKIVAKHLAPGIQCRIFTPHFFVFLSVPDRFIGLLHRVQISLLDVRIPLVGYIVFFIHCIQDNHQIVGAFDGCGIIIIVENDRSCKGVLRKKCEDLAQATLLGIGHAVLFQSCCCDQLTKV